MLRFGGGQLHEVAVSGSTEPGREPTSGALFFWGEHNKKPQNKGAKIWIYRSNHRMFSFSYWSGGSNHSQKIRIYKMKYVSLSLSIDILYFYYLMPRLQKRLIDLFFKKKINGEHSGLLETDQTLASFVCARSCRGMSLNLWWIWRFGAAVENVVWSCRLVFSSMVCFWIQYGGVCCCYRSFTFKLYGMLYLCCYLTKYRTWFLCMLCRGFCY